jgi:hypothetical protein
MSNYLTVGYMQDGWIAELSPKRRSRVLESASGKIISAEDPRAINIMDQAVAHFQLAADVLRRKELPPQVVAR